jgi:hypothetical protein
MENLVMCSKILVDREYLQLKKELRELKGPIIIHKSLKDYDFAKNSFYESIEKAIYTGVGSTDEYHLRYWGITNTNLYEICKKINDLLFKMSDFAKWSENIAFESVYVLIQGLFHSLIDVWDTIYEFSGREGISNMVYKHVYWYFENSIFSKIFQFECHRCKKIVDFIDGSNMCYECS